MIDLDVEINPLTNRVDVGEYYSLCLVYYSKTNNLYPKFISHIREGLALLSEEFPWVAGQVQHERCTDQGANKYKIIPFREVPCLQVENLLKTSSTDFGRRRGEKFPMHWINESHVPIQEPLADSKPSPVMELKFTRELGVDILTISMSSKVVDRAGLIMMVRVLAEACRQKKLPSSDVVESIHKNAAFFNNDKKSPRHDRIPIKFVPAPQSTQSQSYEAKGIDWALFTFDRKAVQYIEDLALTCDSPSESFLDVDIDQAFSAFVFRNICCARDRRLTSGWTARCFRTVDARGARTQTAEAEHLGALQHMTCNSYTNPGTMSIETIARDLHKASSPHALSRDVEHFMFNTGTAIGNPAFISDAIFNPEQDVAIVSWAEIESTSSDFNLSSSWNIRSIRVPYHRPASEGLVYFMPRRKEGEMTVALSLRKTDLKTLMGLAEWTDRVIYGENRLATDVDQH
ncbi:hypothetical protein BFJ72_g550 [Fusarium proliferatum]|uniref:Trichothecene 3-O-acetyltransferase-like N-terminal domain-containing protein n=1 Tax=Gibberella intermedia TaxID=948311 RepID=A0A420UBN3_GIBIN|nr:hypothetical protein BFJ72_g550 [Fusarium proliferatum]